MKETQLLLEQNQDASVKTVRIEFDGGTPCNNPQKGFGNGYGSYKINDEPIYRLRFNRPMSNNVAEISVLIHALRTVYQRGNPEFVMLEIHGDSQIALNRCTRGLTAKQRRSVRNPDFGNACDELRTLCTQFAHVHTNWRGRDASVKLFGH